MIAGICRDRGDPSRQWLPYTVLGCMSQGWGVCCKTRVPIRVVAVCRKVGCLSRYWGACCRSGCLCLCFS